MLCESRQTKTNVKVLLVEDDDIDARLMAIFSMSFLNLFARITHVTSIRGAIEALERESFDVCVLDYWLGQQNCLALLTNIEATQSRMARIILSNITNHQVDDMKLTVNGALFVSKGSCSPKILEDAVERAIVLAGATESPGGKTAARPA